MLDLHLVTDGSLMGLIRLTLALIKDYNDTANGNLGHPFKASTRRLRYR
jgi:hypothetical protein